MRSRPTAAPAAAGLAAGSVVPIAGHHYGMYQIEDTPKGWVRPVAKPTPESLRARIAELRTELAETENQLREMEEGARLEALVKVRNLMRAFELTPADLGLTTMPKRRGRPRKAATRQEQLSLPAI